MIALSNSLRRAVMIGWLRLSALLRLGLLSAELMPFDACAGCWFICVFLSTLVVIGLVMMSCGISALLAGFAMSSDFVFVFFCVTGFALGGYSSFADFSVSCLCLLLCIQLDLQAHSSGGRTVCLTVTNSFGDARGAVLTLAITKSMYCWLDLYAWPFTSTSDVFHWALDLVSAALCCHNTCGCPSALICILVVRSLAAT
jgi:hypothetical protein